jgi:hypothetical protein
VIGVYFVFFASWSLMEARRVVTIGSGVVVIGRTFSLSMSFSLLLLLLD